MVVVAYQTLEDRDNIDEIEFEGPYICRHHGAWLGHGYYLWDTNFDWATDWGLHAYTKYGLEFVIGKCQVDLSKSCFDLVGSVAHQQSFLECIEVMIESGKIKNQAEAIVPNIIQFMKDQQIFDYRSIRASDMYPKIVELKFRKEKQEYMVINQRVQICVIVKKDVLLHPFSVIYPEKYIY